MAELLWERVEDNYHRLWDGDLLTPYEIDGRTPRWVLNDLGDEVARHSSLVRAQTDAVLRYMRSVDTASV